MTEAIKDLPALAPAERAAEQKRQRDENEIAMAAIAKADAEAAVQTSAPSAMGVAAGAASVTVIDNGARINLGTINAVLGFTVTAGFLADIGIDPVGTDRRAVLYRESDFPMICRAIANHVIDKADAFLKVA